MCVVSMVGDYYSDKWQDLTYPDTPTIQPPVTQQQFDKLKRDVEDMKELLKRARKYDEDHDEPACEVEDKVALLRRVAEAVGVDLEDLLP